MIYNGSRADAGFPEFGWSRAEIEMEHKKDKKNQELS